MSLETVSLDDFKYEAVLELLNNGNPGYMRIDSIDFLHKLNDGVFPTKAEWKYFKSAFGLGGSLGRGGSRFNTNISLGKNVFDKLQTGELNAMNEARKALGNYVKKMKTKKVNDLIIGVMVDLLVLIEKKSHELLMSNFGVKTKSININQYKAFESYGSRYAGHRNHGVTEDADLMALDDRISNLEEKVEMMGRRMEEDFMKLRRRFHEHKHYYARRHDEHERAQIKAALRYLEKKLLY
mmetsp:Transcript_32515/g.48128  ORF Transcript_32515/g.48128 Transcript_32515/m.48128 type:complete len:239 (-) Transcript_32515:175-891(-)